MGSHGGKSSKRSSKSPSKVVAAHKARREAGSTLEAIRAHEPATVKGLAAQQASLGVAALWNRKHALAPLGAGAATLATGAASMAVGGPLPGLTAAALAVGAGCQEIARRRGAGAWSGQERMAAGGWAAAAAAWSGATMIVPGMPLWQWAAGMLASVAAPSVMWWRAPSGNDDQDLEPAHEPSIWELALLTVLGELGGDRGPLAGSRLLASPESPAPQVVSVLLGLGYGVHADDILKSSQLQRTIESRLQIPTRGGLTIDRVDNTTLRITASWSQALTTDDVNWELKGEEGQVFMGLDDSRNEIYMTRWKRVKNNKVRVHHGWLVGATGSGKSTTYRNILLPDMVKGHQMLLIADGAGDSMLDLEPYAARYARTEGERYEQVITLAWAIMKSRIKRGGWTGPSPTDPIIALAMDEATTIKQNIDPITQKKVAEIGRLGERFGVSSTQGLQNPVIEDLIGEGGWRNNTKWMIGHAAADPLYSSISSQSTNEEVSLLGLEEGRAAVLAYGKVVARRAKMAYSSSSVVAEAMRGVELPVLHPIDMANVKELWDRTEGWPTFEEEASGAGEDPFTAEDLRLSRWFGPSIAVQAAPVPVSAAPAAGPVGGQPAVVLPGPSTAGDDDLASSSGLSTGGRLHLVPTFGNAPTSAAAPAVQALASQPDQRPVLPGEYADAKDWMLIFLGRNGPHTVAEMEPVSPYSRSTLFDAAKALVSNESIAKHENRYYVLVRGGAAEFGTPAAVGGTAVPR